VIKINKIIFLIFLVFCYSKKAGGEITDGLFMTVGNKPITQSDIVNEIKLILILTNQSYSAKKRDELHEIAVKSTVKRVIKEIEIERNNYYSLSEKEFQTELNRLASNIYVDVETLKNICASNELDFSIIENQIKTELYWNSLIFQMYKNKLTINPDEIEERLKIVQNKEKLEEYLLSEIVIKNVENNLLESKIIEIKKNIELEGFENTAKNFSLSESAMDGGDLGWLNENVISEKIKNVIQQTPIGEITEPILLSDGLLFFKIRNKREKSSELSLEEIKNQLINSEKNKILNMYALSHYDKVRRSVAVNFYND
tara:strand:- start:251 stop:1192 length:942 start_codon:yes stop_codon:yes gene_type:complete